MIHETLIGHLPAAPVASRIRGRDRAGAIWHRVGRIGNVFTVARRRPRLTCRERAVAAQVEPHRLHTRHRPHRIRLPRVGARLEHLRLPRRLLPRAVQVVAEEGCLDLLTKLARRGVAAEWDLTDAVADRLVPRAVIPWAGDHQVRVLGIVLGRLAVDLPRAPRIFLIPEAGDVEVGHRGARDLRVPRLALVVRIVVRMRDDGVPRGNLSVQVLRVDVRHRAELQVPVVGVVDVEVEVRVLELVRLLVDGVLERVTLAQRAVSMIVVVHPLVGRRRLLADGLERRMRHEQRHRRRQPIVRHAVDPHATIVVRDVLHQPVDRVVRVGRLVHVLRRRVHHVHLRRQQERPLRFEAPAQILHDPDVPVLGELLLRGGHRLGRGLRHAIGCAAEEDRQRLGAADLAQDRRLEACPVAHRDHHLFEREDGARRRRLRRRRRLLCAGDLLRTDEGKCEDDSECGAHAFASRTMCVVTESWPTWRIACSAPCTRQPIVVDGSCARPTAR